MLYKSRRKQHFPCNLFGGESCCVGIGQYVQVSYIPIRRSFHYSVLIKCQETLVLCYFSPPMLNTLMKIVDMMENVFQVHLFKNRINVISKSFPDFWRVQYCRYCSMFMPQNINFYREDGELAFPDTLQNWNYGKMSLFVCSWPMHTDQY